ncbi:MAG: tetratricopeptide repeat protein [Aggregatilineales bacterium]
MSERLFVVARRGVSEIPLRILTEHLQVIEMQLVATGGLSRDHVIVLLTPATLERCLEPKDAIRNVLQDAQQQKMRLIALHSPYFNPSEQARYAADLLARAEPLPLEYGRWEESLQALARLLGVSVQLPPLTAEERRQLQAQEAFERALSLPADDLAGKRAAYDEAIRIYPDFAEAYARRGGLQLAKGDWAACLADCQTALRLKPSLAEAHHNRAMALARQGNYAESLASYSEALRLDPRNPRAYLNRGVAKVNLGDLDGAIADYSAAIDLNPNFAEAYFNRSLAHGQRDDLQAAIKDYAQALALNLNAHQAAAQGDIAATIAYLQRLLRRFPDHPQAEQVRREIARLRDLAND